MLVTKDVLNGWLQALRQLLHPCTENAALACLLMGSYHTKSAELPADMTITSLDQSKDHA
jgi:hypothetical protein